MKRLFTYRVYLYKVYFVLLSPDVSCYLNTEIGVGNVYERVHLGFFRRWAASECLKQIKADDLFTDCISIGPVSCYTQSCDL